MRAAGQDHDTGTEPTTERRRSGDRRAKRGSYLWGVRGRSRLAGGGPTGRHPATRARRHDLSTGHRPGKPTGRSPVPSQSGHIGHVVSVVDRNRPWRRLSRWWELAWAAAQPE